MLYDLYSALKAELIKESFIKKASWFNNQYDEGMVVTTSAFIEFDQELVNQLATKSNQRVELPFRVHFVKKITASKDATIPESSISEFDTQANAVVTRLKGFWPLNGEGLKLTEGPCKLAKIRSFQKKKGWQAWFFDFTVKINTLTILK